MIRRRSISFLVATILAALLCAPAVSSLAGPAERGTVGETAAKKKSKRAGRAEKPNPTPLWSLYPLRQGEVGDDPQADTDALSTPPVKPTEQGAPETDAGAVRTADREEGSGDVSVVPLLTGVAALTVLLLAVGIARGRRRARPRPAPGPIIPATPSAKARSVLAAAPSTAGAVRTPAAPEVVAGRAPVSSNGSRERPRDRPRPAAGPQRPDGDAELEEAATEAAEERPPSATAPEGSGPPAPLGDALSPQDAAAEPPEEPVDEAAPDRPRPGDLVVEKPAPTPDTAGPPPERDPVVEREHVRVYLFDGRVVEGYKRGHYSKENRVLVLDVDKVYDADGRELPSTPLDSFLLPPQIDRIEPLDEPSDPPNAAARGGRGGKLPAS